VSELRVGTPNLYYAVDKTTSGYNGDIWYDAVNVDVYDKIYEFTPAVVDGDMYVSVHTYFENTIPAKCFENDALPVISVKVSKGTTYANSVTVTDGSISYGSSAA